MQAIRFRTKHFLFVLCLMFISGCGPKKTDQISTSIHWDLPVVESCRPLRLQTMYGAVTLHEPVLIELIASKAMQRLKKINQHGINDIVIPQYAFSRYDHSVGVCVLIQKFGGSLEEQVAGLLHDVSHTVFSHVGDLVFAPSGDRNTAYQDDIHEWYIEQTDLLPILQKYDMHRVVSDDAKKTFKLLEQEYPDLCADRIDYQLRTAYIVGLISLQELQCIIQHLHFEDERWFFDDIHAARIFGDISLWLTRNMYASATNTFLYKIAADIFNRALAIGIITKDDLHFSDDDTVWQRITKDPDIQLRHMLQQIASYKAAYEPVSKDDAYDYHRRSKCRVVDPLVLINQELVRLSSVDREFAEQYEAIQLFCKEGIYLKFHT